MPTLAAMRGPGPAHLVLSFPGAASDTPLLLVVAPDAAWHVWRNVSSPTARRLACSIQPSRLIRPLSPLSTQATPASVHSAIWSKWKTQARSGSAPASPTPSEFQIIRQATAGLGSGAFSSTAAAIRTFCAAPQRRDLATCLSGLLRRRPDVWRRRLPPAARPATLPSRADQGSAAAPRHPTLSPMSIASCRRSKCVLPPHSRQRRQAGFCPPRSGHLRPGTVCQRDRPQRVSLGQARFADLRHRRIGAGQAFDLSRELAVRRQGVGLARSSRQTAIRSRRHRSCRKWCCRSAHADRPWAAAGT